jgi:sialidase-1
VIKSALLLLSAVASLLLALAHDTRAAEQNEIPAFQNPQIVHVTVESSQPNEYLSICPNVCELADGSLLMAYHRTTQVDFSGKYSTWARVSRDGGKTWSNARPFAEHLQAPGLLRLRSGDILLNGCTVINDRWSTTMRLFRSKDGGQTWTEQKPIWEKSKGIRLQGGCASLVQLKSGRILCPMFGSDILAADYGQATWQQKAGCYCSDDDGKTWREGKGKVSLPKRGAMEPTVAELNDGSLVMALRSQLGFVYVSRSLDGGETWSEAWSSGLEAPEAPLVMTAFPDGKALLMVYCSGKFDPNHHHSGERTPLTAAVSRDAGKKWHKIGDIVGGFHEFGATSICFTSSGKVAMAYDWCRIPWDRTVKTGGVRLAIAEKEWFDKKELDPAYRNDPAFKPVHDDPSLPRVLLIGDSISMGYTAPVQNALARKANVHRIPDNGRHTKQGLEDIDGWLGDDHWDVIHFNFGIHDLTIVQDKYQVPLPQYEQNLRKLVERLKKTKAKLIWCSTTPVPSDYDHGILTITRSNADVIAYNAVAKRIMEENRIAIDDLYAFALPQLEKIQGRRDVHFTAAGSNVLAGEVVATILTALRDAGIAK